MTAQTKTEVTADVRVQLIKNAVDCTYYVATGNSMARELAQKYGIGLEEARVILSTVACDLVDRLRAM